MRWPTTSISDSDSSTRVFPEASSLSRLEVAAERSPRSTFSIATTPDAARASSVARSSRHWSLPSHNGLGGSTGSGVARSKRHAFWLLEPELSTRIFISIGPFPVANFRQVVATFANVLFVLDESVAQMLFEVRSNPLQTRNTVNYISCKVKTIQIVQNCHIERRRGGSFFLVSADMEVAMIGAPIRQAVDQPRIAVVGKDDRLVGREDRVELIVRETVRMFGGGLDRHQVDHVDHPDLDVGKILAKQVNRGQCFEGRNIARARHHHVRFDISVGGRPLPDAESSGAVLDCRLHIKILQRRLFARDDHVHVIA